MNVLSTFRIQRTELQGERGLGIPPALSLWGLTAPQLGFSHNLGLLSSPQTNLLHHEWTLLPTRLAWQDASSSESPPGLGVEWPPYLTFETQYLLCGSNWLSPAHKQTILESWDHAWST